ncbi:MAG TPA: S-methyl-5-thioribose-1-phosphate isomerase [Candidatus Limnocylindrales bacterium]|nr:S-methyl-5-thioribose-1-phosphate isomerase [Candidatus Limnocylindrales bacterium]
MTDPTDPDRRQFFRRFAGEVVRSAASVAGAVGELRERSTAEAASLLRGDPDEVHPSADVVPASASTTPASAALTTAAPPLELASAPAPPGPRGFRTPFRFGSPDGLLVIDQRRLPDELIEVSVRDAHDAAKSIRDMIVRGAPAIGQVAALGLALQAHRALDAQPRPRRVILQEAAETLRAARPTAVNLGGAVDRMMARYQAIGPLTADGGTIERELMAEAEAIVAEATDEHGRMAEAGLGILPTPPDRPLQVLTHCNTGPLAAGQYGTALGVVQAAHHADRSLHVWVDETRPYLQGARLTTWELDQAGVTHTLIPDMAAGPLMARGEVDVIVVGGDRVALNGDTANKIGTYTLAVLAKRHGVPFYVVAPLTSVDLGTPDGSAIPIEERPAEEVTTIRGVRIAPVGTEVFNPAFDVTPAELITGIVTDEGVVTAPYEAGLRAAVERRAARRAGSAVGTAA